MFVRSMKRPYNDSSLINCCSLAKSHILRR